VLLLFFLNVRVFSTRFALQSAGDSVAMNPILRRVPRRSLLLSTYPRMSSRQSAAPSEAVALDRIRIASGAMVR
jgi:hypothetical protein